MAAMAMPRDAGDDLWLYMRKIIEEEFPKALRQAFNTLWDKKICTSIWALGWLLSLVQAI